MNIEDRTAMCDGVCQHRGRSGSLVALSSCSCLSHPIRQAGLSNHISCHLCLKYFLNIMTNISFPSPWGEEFGDIESLGLDFFCNLNPRNL